MLQASLPIVLSNHHRTPQSLKVFFILKGLPVTFSQLHPLLFETVLRKWFLGKSYKYLDILVMIPQYNKHVDRMPGDWE